jgi:predicted site-specific integrase-resolvase
MLLKQTDIKRLYKIDRVSLYSYERNGFLKSYRTPGNHRRYLQEDIDKLLGIHSTINKKVACYARVSTKKQEPNLHRQMDRLKAYCNQQGYYDVVMFYDIASGLNDRRRQFNKLLDLVIKGQINTIVVEYKDRLCRFGLNIITNLLKGYCCNIEYVENTQQEERNEIVEDVLSIITSYSARLYGKRSHKPEIKQKLEL